MAIGIALSLFGAVLFAVGNIAEKRSVDRMEKFSIRQIVKSIRQLQKSWVWIFGALVSVLGAFVQLFAYHFVSISIVQSMSLAGVVLVVISSRIHFQETLGSREWVGLAVCAFAFLMTVLSFSGGGTSPGKGAPANLILITALATSSVAALLLGLSQLRHRSVDVVHGIAAGLFYGLVGVFGKELVARHDHGAIIKLALEMLSTPYLYLMFISWAIALAIFQSGLQRGRIGILAPLSGSLSSIYIVAVGTPVFGEVMPHKISFLILRFVGFGGILFGSVLLSQGAQQAMGDAAVR